MRIKYLGAKRDEITGERRKLRNAELQALGILNLDDRWAGHVARMEKFRNATRILVEKPEGKRPLGSAIRRWEDSIKMDLREVVCVLGDRIDLAQDRAKDDNEPPVSLKAI